MKKSSKISMLLAMAAVILPGCNDIDSEERFIELSPIEGNRVVLLEDYTGQGCPNCPEGHRVIEQLVEQYPGKVMAVSIHAGEFAISATTPNYVGLKPAFGDAMSADRGVSEYPAGVIDGQGPSLHANWPTAVRDALQVAALCEIEIDGFSYDEATRNLGATVTVLPGKSASAALGIWIIEDGIVARQYNVNGDNKWDRNYVHDHVLRSYATNSVWGDPVTLVRDEESSRDFSVILDPTWNVDNISVVAFVTDMGTGEYLQTAYAHVNLSNEE